MLCTYSVVIHHSDVSSEHTPWYGTKSSDYPWISCVSPYSLSMGLGLAMVPFPHFSFVFFLFLFIAIFSTACMFCVRSPLLGKAFFMQSSHCSLRLPRRLFHSTLTYFARRLVTILISRRQVSLAVRYQTHAVLNDMFKCNNRQFLDFMNLEVLINPTLIEIR